MELKQKRKKLRLLIGKLNKERRRQAQKIDILCNDFIGTQKEFIRKLSTISFTATAYELLLSAKDLNSILDAACRLIREELPDANIAFFLRRDKSIELNIFESDQPIALGKQGLENSFTPEIIDYICRMNKPCTLKDIFAMGYPGSLSELNKISAVTVPLGLLGQSLGFILLYHNSEKNLALGEMHNIIAILPGLSGAIQSCCAAVHLDS